MGLHGNQYHFCSNCGTRLYDSTINMDHTMSLLCSDSCREQWRLKYARMILGKDAPKEEAVSGDI